MPLSAVPNTRAAKAAPVSHDFTEMDNASISPQHWKIMFISGMGFLPMPTISSSSASSCRW